MVVTVIRAVIVYVLIMGAMRLMGKRQIGELQPSELIITILLSELIVIPLQDNELPMLNSLIAVLILISIEVISSVLSMKSKSFRKLEEGNPIIVIRDGIIDQQKVKQLRFTVEDLFSSLRLKDVFDISLVQYAILETNGRLSVLLKPEHRTTTPSDLQLAVPQDDWPMLVVADGEILGQGLQDCGLTKKHLEGILHREHTALSDIYIMTCDKLEHVSIIRKEPGV